MQVPDEVYHALSVPMYQWHRLACGGSLVSIVCVGQTIMLCKFTTVLVVSPLYVADGRLEVRHSFGKEIQLGKPEIV